MALLYNSTQWFWLSWDDKITVITSQHFHCSNGVLAASWSQEEPWRMSAYSRLWLFAGRPAEFLTAAAGWYSLWTCFTVIWTDSSVQKRRTLRVTINKNIRFVAASFPAGFHLSLVPVLTEMSRWMSVKKTRFTSSVVTRLPSCQYLFHSCSWVCSLHLYLILALFPALYYGCCTTCNYILYLS